MSIKVNYTEAANEEIEVDLTKFSQDKEFLYIECAKIISISETQENAEIEVRARLKLPIENALDSFARLMDTLVSHENEHKTGYGIKIPEED